jgi:hypothetical protein
MQPHKLANMTPVQPYPTPTTNSNNHQQKSPDDDNTTMCTSNCSRRNSIQQPPAETAFNVTGINVASNQAIADAGATGHFVLPGTPVTDIAPATQPLTINLPDGETLISTHTCRLHVPGLPAQAREAHIVPGLAHASLVSIKILCDAGCRVTYDDENAGSILNRNWFGLDNESRPPAYGSSPLTLPKRPTPSPPTGPKRPPNMLPTTHIR